MLLAIDIGNSSIKFGLFDRDQLTKKFSIPTKPNATAGDLKAAVGNELDVSFSEVIVCSVVPQIENSLQEFLEQTYSVSPMFVDSSFDFGLTTKYEPITAVGPDRLVNAFAAVRKYGKPAIICSFGTATTIDAVNSEGEYLGGIIAPGMNTLAEALHLKAAKLPRVEIAKPETVIGNTTIGSIQSGIFYGYIGLVEGILARMTAELLSVPPATAGGTDLRVIATGGFARIIAAESPLIEVVDENLTLEGLFHLIKRNSLRTVTL